MVQFLYLIDNHCRPDRSDFGPDIPFFTSFGQISSKSQQQVPWWTHTAWHSQVNVGPLPWPHFDMHEPEEKQGVMMYSHSFLLFPVLQCVQYSPYPFPPIPRPCPVQCEWATRAHSHQTKATMKAKKVTEQYLSCFILGKLFTLFYLLKGNQYTVACSSLCNELK